MDINSVIKMTEEDAKIKGIKSLIQFAEEDAKIKGINLKSPKTKEILQIWSNFRIAKALEEGNLVFAFNLTVFNEWVQNY